MNITDALYRAAHNYPGGLEALAMRMGISASSLAHKVSPNYPGAHCSPTEVVMIMEFTSDHSALQAMAGRMRYMLLPMVPDGEMDGEFAQRLAGSVKEFGEFIAEISSDLSDGRVTDNELKRIERELAEMQSATAALYALAARLNRDAKPSHLRAA
ncbi:MAG: hypothetical protein RL375_783 [Pseudomonadota bacterium]|jgi:hypothetical protein